MKNKTKNKELPKASIVVLTHNRAKVLDKTLKGMLRLDYPNEYEVIVVNDGSTDNTKDVLNSYQGNKKIVAINEERFGPCKARNNGIKAARFPIVVIMDDDCIPSKDWLINLARGFDSPKTGMVSSYSLFGGTSTAFRASVLDKVNSYDEEYFYYREDTDLVFKILDAGYKGKLVDAEFKHDHKLEKPSLGKLINHALERASYHKNDVLLYKKHSERARKFLNVKFGFIVDPLEDFNRATGRWADIGRNEGRTKNISLSSPRGLTYLENKTPIHTISIVLAGLLYVLLVKLVRLYGSVKFKKLLI